MSDKLINIENIKGTTLADFIGGNNSNNILDAYMGDGNTLVGSGGDDTLLGSSNGNDIFKAGILQPDGSIVDGDDGNNLINGVGGTSNTVDYSAYASNRTIEVNLNLTNTVSKKLNGNSAYAKTDTITNITNITGGSGADTIIGSSTQNNTLLGGAGNDTISGGGGKNYLDGGAGDADYVSYNYLASGEKVVVELSGEEIKSDKGQYKKLILKEIN